MSVALQRRLHKLEEVLLPKPRPPVCMLCEPASEAPAEERAEYRRQVDEAKARGDFLILVLPMRPAESWRTENGVTCCGTELDALELKASMLPCRRGNKSLPSDVPGDRAGHVFRLLARNGGEAADPAPRVVGRRAPRWVLARQR